MSVIGEQRAKARGEFISYREVIEKLVAETKDSLADWAEELRAKEIHFTGGRRYTPGRIIDGGYEEEPLGSLLEQTAEAGKIPFAYDVFHKWGPDNVGWLRAKLVENLKAAGLPAPASLLESSPEYAPRCPLPAPAEEDANQYPPAPLASAQPAKTKKRETQGDRVEEWMKECERRAAEGSVPFERLSMPGTKVEFLALLHALDPELQTIKAVDSLDRYLKEAGCRWPLNASAQPSAAPIYQRLFPEAYIRAPGAVSPQRLTA